MASSIETPKKWERHVAILGSWGYGIGAVMALVGGRYEVGFTALAAAFYAYCWGSAIIEGNA